MARQDQTPAEITKEAIAFNVNLMAALTANFLDAWTKSLGLLHRPKFPAEFLLELGGILRLAMLEHAGLTGVLGLADFNAQDLLGRLLDRLFLDLPSLSFDCSNCTSRVTETVVLACVAHLPINAPINLGAELAVASPLSDECLEALADFLFQQRSHSS